MNDIGIVDMATCYPFLPPELFMSSGSISPATPEAIRNITDLRLEIVLPAFNPYACSENALTFAVLLESISPDTAAFRIYATRYGVSGSLFTVPVIEGSPDTSLSSYVRVRERPASTVQFHIPAVFGTPENQASYAVHPDFIYIYQEAPSITGLNTSDGMCGQQPITHFESLGDVSSIAIVPACNLSVSAAEGKLSLTASAGAGTGKYSLSLYPYFTRDPISGEYHRISLEMGSTGGLLSINGLSSAVSLVSGASVDLQCGSAGNVITVTIGAKTI